MTFQNCSNSILALQACFALSCAHPLATIPTQEKSKPQQSTQEGNPDFSFDMHSGSGLSVKLGGIEVIRGSSFQYYEPGWTKGYYSSTYGKQTVEKVDADTRQLTFRSSDGLAQGSERVHQEAGRLAIHYHFEWNGENAVKIELTTASIWAPAFEAGSITADGQPTRSLSPTAYNSKSDLAERRYGLDSNKFRLTSPLGQIEILDSRPTTLFDGRGYGQDWAEGKELWWHGALSLDVGKGAPVDLDETIELKASPPPPELRVEQNIKFSEMSNAESPDESIPVLIPKPKASTLNFLKPVPLVNEFVFPAGRVRFWDRFKSALARRFIIPTAAKGASPLRVDGGVSKLGIQPGGYSIDIRPGTISVLGEEDEGLQNALYRLAAIVFVKNGALYLPSGHLDDEPKVQFRGVHLFAGPEARAFQQKLWDRVLLPLGMNKVVIECERTAWKSTPIDPSQNPMKREDLAGLFEDYRKVGVEPIPLIQSLGHMEWFFAGKQRLDLAVNPDEPYTIDPRKAGTKPAMEKLWSEAIDLLKPQRIHFGCDEVDMIGMEPHRPALVTDLWRSQMSNLGQISKSHSVQPMFWGDEALAPGEAADAMNGDSKSEAAERRACIPAGAIVCDWHYRDDARPELFYPSLQLWKREGFTPIAAAWYRPDNVIGIDSAAVLERSGTLQTTWAGYESNERAMIENSNQFTAMVLAADYSWSGRQESRDHLDYDPTLVFRRMYFGEPLPVRPHTGQSVEWQPTGKKLTIGSNQFRLQEPIKLRSILTADQVNSPTVVDLAINRTHSHLAIALDTVRSATDGDAVGEVEIFFSDGTSERRRLVYGHHIRAVGDKSLVPYADRSAGLCSLRFDFGKPRLIARAEIRSIGASSGLRLFGITLW